MYIYHNCRCKVNRIVLNFLSKSSKLLIDLMLFQSLGATSQNALCPKRIVFVRGITNKFLELERSVRVSLY